MENNNTLTFDNHETYIYYPDELIKRAHVVNLIPTNPDDTGLVRYTSFETNLFTNGVNNGLIKFNTFDRYNLNQNITIISVIGTIITNDGILMSNAATERNSSNITITGLQTKGLATYKSGKYANYINVEIQVDFEDGYRILTISY